MSDASTNEQLLTALLDGQLVGDERARAEKMLADHPHLQQKVQGWRSSGIAMRAWPKYELDEKFSSRVMQAIATGSVTAQVPRSTSSPLTNWRSGLAAIVSLAAMLLLTLFVFPPLSQTNTMAKRVAGKAPVTAAEVAMDVPKEIAAESKEKQIAAERSEESEGSEFASDSGMADTREHETAGLDQKPVPSSAAGEMADSIGSDQGLGGFDGGFDGGMGGGMGGSASPELAQKTNLRSLSGTAAATAPSDAVEMSEPSAAAIEDSLSAKDLEADNGQSPLVQNGATGVNPTSVNQLFVVDFRAVNQPLVTLTEVLARNQIQIVDNEMADENSAEAAGNAFGESDLESFDKQNSFRQNSLKKLTQNSNDGLEAVYVVSTPLQMQQAIEQLSDQANIMGYQVPQSGSNEASVLMKNSIKLQSAQSDSNKKSEADGISATSMDRLIAESRAELQMEPEKRASAQQLQPFEFNQRNRGGVRYSADAKYPIQSESLFSDKKGESASELVQYLLLVQTGSPSSGPASGGAAAPPAPAAEVKH